MPKGVQSISRQLQNTEGPMCLTNDRDKAGSSIQRYGKQKTAPEHALATTGYFAAFHWRMDHAAQSR